MKTEENTSLLLAEKDALISALKEQNFLLQAQNKALQEVVTQLQWQVKQLQKKIFGKSSERFVDDPQPFFPGLEPTPISMEQACEEEVVQVPAHEKKKAKSTPKNTITYPDDLPVDRQIIDLPEEQKIDPKTGESLVCIGEEITRRLCKKSASYLIKEIVRKKYALSSNPDAGIRIADKPESLLNRCQAHESLLADIVVNKYCNHIPLYRQSEMLTRDKIFISRQTLSGYMIKIGQILAPLHSLLQQEILASGNIFIDETPIDVLCPGKGKTHQGYMLVIAGGSSLNPALRVYHFLPDRKHAHFEEIFKDYQGVFHSDDYGVYEKMAKQDGVIWSPCMAHVRRPFFEAEAGDKAFREEVLKDIQHLFAIEEKVKDLPPEERVQIREQEAVPVLEALIEKNKKKLTEGTFLPKFKMTQAIKYLLRLSPYLKNYITNPYARIDNNVAERALKHVVIGRKNWLFVGGEDGGESSAVLYSLAQSCRALNINPLEYFEDVFLRFQSHPANRLRELLPHNWKKN